MNIIAIACKVIDTEDLYLTANQIEALLNIINEMPEIEKHALEGIEFDANPNPHTTAARAIKSLKNNKAFVAIISPSVMPNADLDEILAVISTGNKDNFWLPGTH